MKYVLPWLPEVLVSPPVISALYLWGGEDNLWRHAILLSLPLAVVGRELVKPVSYFVT